MKFGHDDDTCWLELDGDLRYPLARSLRPFFEDVVLPSTRDTTVVDLRGVTAIDSTWMGVLAKVGSACLGKRHRRAVLVCPPGVLAQTLHAMCFDKLFTEVVELAEAPTVPLEPVQAAAVVPESLAETMLDAHRALSDVDPHNASRFREVIGALERSVARHA